MIQDFLLELVSLSVVIFAVVALIKQMGVRGRALTIASFVFGLLFGISYRYQASPMTDFNSWFWAIVFGLLSGAMASGAYKGIESASGKPVLEEVFNAAEYEPEYERNPEPQA